MKVGVIGGTFDPVHYGHLILAEQIAGHLGISKTLFIPSNEPPHKDAGSVAPIRHRIEMLRYAIEGNDAFELSLIEYERGGKSYSYETFRVLSEAYPKGTDFYFIAGSDVLYDLPSFKKVEELLKQCCFAVVARLGSDMLELRKTAERLRLTYGARIDIVPFLEIGISSTMIRKKVKLGESVQYLSPEKVVSYIKANGLYM